MHSLWSVVLMAVSALAAPSCLAGEGFGIGIGVTDAIDGERTPALTASWLSSSRHPWELSAGYLGDRHRLEQGPAPVTVFVAVSKRLTWHGWFVSGGLALIDKESDVLSGHGQFYTGVGFEAERVALSLRHLSNGDTGGRNRGETLMLLEYRF